jgi:hypothetical protein
MANGASEEVSEPADKESSEDDDEEAPSSSSSAGEGSFPSGREGFLAERVAMRPERWELGRPNGSSGRTSASMRAGDEEREEREERKERREEETGVLTFLMLKWASLVAICFLGALPPEDFLWVCFVRAIYGEDKETGKTEGKQRRQAWKEGK